MSEIEVNKNPITLLWSGGYDSTAMIFHYLNERPEAEIRLLSVNLYNNEEQSAAELVARKRIFDIIIPRAPKPDNLTLIEQDWPTIHANRTGGSWPSLIQPAMWVYSAVFSGAPGDIAFGWVRGDDVWHYKQDVKNLANALAPFIKSCEMLFPFEWRRKEDLLYLYQGNKDVFHLLSSCEDGKPWSTHNCPKCLELRELAKKLQDIPDLIINPLEKLIKEVKENDS